MAKAVRGYATRWAIQSRIRAAGWKPGDRKGKRRGERDTKL